MTFKHQFSRQDTQVEKETDLYHGHLTLKGLALKHRLFTNNDWSPTISRELIQRPEAVAVLPYNPQTKQIVLIEQFRVGALQEPSPWILELVAGLSEENETLESVAKRESLEEAGLDIQQLIPIASYYLSPGASAEKTHLYIGYFNALPKNRHHGLVEEGEDIQSHVFNFEEIVTLINDNVIINASTLIALQWLLANHETLT